MLILVGCNHRSAPVALRERMAISDEALSGALSRLLSHEGIREGLILSTCNRVEVLARSILDEHRSIEQVKRYLCEERSVATAELEIHGYHFVGQAAARHVFEVACGLDSMILGEPQVLGQVKRAYCVAQEVGATGSVIDQLMQRCLAGARRVRAETGLSRNALSVAHAAVNLAKQIFGDLADRKALLVGAGKMTAMVARHLASQGLGQMYVTSRTYVHAVSLAEQFRARAVNWEDGLSRIDEVDVVISGTGSHQPVLDRSRVAAALRARRGAPLFLIDIAVPRDIDPEVNLLDNVYLYDIDALQDVVDANREERRRAAELARQEIGVEVSAFERWRQSRRIQPTIVALRESVLGVAQAELARHRRRLGALTPEQERGIEEMTRALLQKLLHRPILHLRNALERGDVRATTTLFREIFGFDEAVEEREGGAEEREGGNEEGGDDGEAPGGTMHLLRGGKD